MRTKSPMIGVGCGRAGQRVDRRQREVGVDPQLGQLVGDRGRRRPGRRRPASARRAGRLSRHHAPAAPTDAARSSTAPPLICLRRRPARPRRGARGGPRSASVSSAATGEVRLRCASSTSGGRVQPEVDRLVELEARPACAGPGRRGSARARRPRRAARRRCRCRRPRPALVMGDGGAGRGVARISTSSAASSTPASRTPPSGRYSTSLARAAAMTCWDRGARAACRSCGSSGLTRRSTSSDSSPISSGRLTLTSSRSSSRSDLLNVRVRVEPAAGQRQPHRRQRLAQPDAAWPRSVRTSSTARRTVDIAFSSASSRSAASSASGQR